jgi:hypothetical protein
MLTITPFTPEWTPAVQAFNQRLLTGGLDATLQFPETPDPEFSPQTESYYQEYFLATKGNAVRGAYFLTREPWSIAGDICGVGNYRLPLSEGLVNPEYRGVSLAIIRHALKRQPLMYCLGMGSYDRPLPRSLQAMKWPMFSTPFFFKSRRPARLLRNLASVRKSPLRRIAFDLAAATGAGWVAIKAAQALQSKQTRGEDLHSAIAGDFGDWSDELWDQVRPYYLSLAVRNSAILRIRYPEKDPRFIKLKMMSGNSVVGWSILLDTQMHEHKHFGNLRVGTIVDCLARPEHACQVVRLSAAELEKRGVDLIISNQSHEVWCHAFRSAGFLEGPSNRIFAASPKLAERIQPFHENQKKLHLTRGDAAGPIHL